MELTRSQKNRVHRLADDVHVKIMSKMEMIAEGRGRIIIEAFPKGDGFDITLTVTT